MAYRQKGEVKLMEDEIVARVRFETAQVLKRYLDVVIPEVVASFAERIAAADLPKDIQISGDEIRARIEEVWLRRLSKGARRALDK